MSMGRATALGRMPRFTAKPSVLKAENVICNNDVTRGVVTRGQSNYWAVLFKKK